MKQVLGIKNKAARMKVTPPRAVALLADNMRWNPNDARSINFNPLRGVVPCAHRAIFKRLSLGGYGDLTCIKSIWVDSSSPGDNILRLAMSNGHVHSRVAPVNQCQFPIPRAKNGHFQSL